MTAAATGRTAMRWACRLLLTMALVGVVSPAAPSIAAVPSVSAPNVAQLIGQKLMVTMSGQQASASLLGRIRRGEIGGVVLLGSNISSASQLRALSASLQHAASAGGQPRLLIAVDQEGGSIKRVPWIAPWRSPPQMGASGSNRLARNQGAQTGSGLRNLGINVDLAPVADVPRTRASFMYQQGRTFSFDAGRTARLADAFALGLGDSLVVAAMKHFPGIGLATRNTDYYADTITASKATLATDLRPYRRAIGNGIPMIMLSNATYPAYDPYNAAGWSAAIVTTLLRQDLGFRGVTITDALNGAASSRGTTQASLAARSANAGTDMLLLVGSEAATAQIYDGLLRRARAGQISRSRLLASYDRILALKARMAP